MLCVLCCSRARLQWQSTDLADTAERAGEAMEHNNAGIIMLHQLSKSDALSGAGPISGQSVPRREMSRNGAGVSAGGSDTSSDARHQSMSAAAVQALQSRILAPASGDAAEQGTVWEQRWGTGQAPSAALGPPP